jgi:hypothetical protein
MSRMVSRGRIVPVAAVLLGLIVLGMLALTVVLDSLTHYPGTGGPWVDSMAVGAAGIPAAAVATLLAARRPGNPIGWLLFGILFAGAGRSSPLRCRCGSLRQSRVMARVPSTGDEKAEHALDGGRFGEGGGA